MSQRGTIPAQIHQRIESDANDGDLARRIPKAWREIASFNTTDLRLWPKLPARQTMPGLTAPCADGRLLVEQIEGIDARRGHQLLLVLPCRRTIEGIRRLQNDHCD
jgi:hypothetical protein